MGSENWVKQVDQTGESELDFSESLVGVAMTQNSDPFELLAHWIAAAEAHEAVKEPRAMVLATLSPAGFPAGRVVLLKEASVERGLVFYTNYLSAKGRDLAECDRASLTFFWDPLYRQVRIQGLVSKTSREDSVAYWASRPRGAQLSQYISAQSMVLPSRKTLEAQVADADLSFTSGLVPCPDHWGGYSLKPLSFEFWVGRENRLHDRWLFERLEMNLAIDQRNETETALTSGWKIKRLYP